MNKPRCYNHRDRAEMPTCSTCRRIEVEQDIVTRAVDALLNAGYRLATNDGESVRPDTPTDDRAVILHELMDVDDEWLGVYRNGPFNGPPDGWVRFVYGNDGWDVINDYTVNLEAALQPVNDYVDSIAP